MKIEEHLKILAKQANSKNSNIIAYDETTDWPDGRLEKLIEMAVLIPTHNATSIKCPGCDESCPVEPLFDVLDDGQNYIHVLCRQEGRDISIEPELLQQWEITDKIKQYLPKTKKNRNTAPVMSREQKEINEKTLIISTLLTHHSFDNVDEDGQELMFEAIGQDEIATQLKWNQSKVSRVLKRSFPEGFWDRYKLACKSDALKGFLKSIDDDQVAIEAIA